jgi:hypothetical protein
VLLLRQTLFSKDSCADACRYEASSRASAEYPMKHLFLDVSVCAVNAVSERTNELMRGESIKVLLSLLYAIVKKCVWLCFPDAEFNKGEGCLPVPSV